MKKSNYSWISYCLVFISALGLFIGCPDPVIPEPDPDVQIFTVTISGLPDANGNNVTASPMSGPNGTEITVTVIVAEGYRLVPGTLKFNAANVPASRKFILRNNVTITAQFEEDEEEDPDPDPDPELPISLVYDDIEWDKDTDKMLLKWEPVTGAAKYEIYHAGSRLGSYTLIDTVTSAGNYTPTNPNPNKYENYYRIVALRDNNTEINRKLISLELSMFGPDTYFYDIKYDSATDIAAEINNISTTITRNGHWTSRRFAFYFKPGRYNYSGNIDIGFFTSISGLGAIPTDTIIGGVTCLALLGGNNVTQNFWRSIENLSVQSGTFRWSVSQAAPARRMHATVRTVFDQDNGWASGGFLSDSYHTAFVGTYSGQQFYARNNRFSEAFTGGSWHKTVMGTDGAKNETTTNGNSTYFDSTPIIREKPFLYYNTDIEEYMVFVPALREDAVGTSWSIDGDIGEGKSILLASDKFYIAKPSDTAQSINEALDSGKHVYFLPGLYSLSTPLRVKNPNTILLGSGYATLNPAQGNTYGTIYVDDVPGVTVASLMLDAGTNSTYLLCMGEYGADKDHSDNPSLLADLFFRVGGARGGSCNVDISALINSNNVIGDHFWAWRADHGSGVGWNTNRSKNGVVVTGDDVTMYGLFVEHYHEYEVLWLGENGRVYFLQNERPYDSPATTGWRNPRRPDVEGWSAYKVANHVEKHFVAGAGMYGVFNNNSRASSAMELPRKPGVEALNINTYRISGTGAQLSVISGAGPSSIGGDARKYIHTYVNGVSSQAPTEGYDPPDEEFDIPTNLIP